MPEKLSEEVAAGLARVIYEAYPESELLAIDPEDLKDLDTLYAASEDIGDSLFRMVVGEAREGACDEDADRVVRLLNTVVADAMSVRDAVLRYLKQHGLCENYVQP